MRKILIPLIMLSVLSGCSSGYHPRNFFGGYSDMQIQDETYRVSFSGNGYTSSQRAADFALLRCSELTLSKGHKYFAIVSDNSEIERSFYTAPATTYHSGRINTYGGSGSYHGFSQTIGGQTYNISKPVIQYVIRTFEEKPADVFCYYDAKQISDNIRANYKLH